MNDNQEDDIVFGDEIAQFKREIPPPPPPPGFTSPFKTIQEWLFHICDTNEQPEKSISEYNFGLYEAPGDYLLSLVGYNYIVEGGVPTARIDFKPASHIFLALPKEEYRNLSQQQVRERVLNQLKEFITNTKFYNSFLSKGHTITYDHAGEIWSR